MNKVPRAGYFTLCLSRTSPFLRTHPAAEGLPLVELHLDHNYIGKAENVGSDKLADLRVLRLGFNGIGNLSKLKNCVSLTTLDVRFNK